MAFSRETFEQTLTDIETRLGYLRGNENAWKYLREIQLWYVDNVTVGGILDVVRLNEGYTFPCPEGRFQVKPYRTFWLDIYTLPGTTFDKDAFVTSLQESASMAFEDGVAWARGVAAYARSLCDQFLKPDVPTLVSAVLDMQRDVVSPLVDAPNDDWANLGGLNQRWTGDAAAAFNEFYLNYNDTLARDGIYANLVNVGFAASANVISGTQFGAQFFVESILESLNAQLEQWARWDMEPPEFEPLPTWVADVLKIGKSAFKVAADIIPVVGDAAKKIDEINSKSGNATQLIKDIEEVSGKDILPEKAKDIPVKTAEEIYTGLTETLHADYLTAYQDALDQLQQGGPDGGTVNPSELTKAAFSGQGVIEQMRSDKGQGDWTLPDVKDESLRDGDDDY